MDKKSLLQILASKKLPQVEDSITSESFTYGETLELPSILKLPAILKVRLFYYSIKSYPRVGTFRSYIGFFQHPYLPANAEKTLPFPSLASELFIFLCEYHSVYESAELLKYLLLEVKNSLLLEEQDMLMSILQERNT